MAMLAFLVYDEQDKEVTLPRVSVVAWLPGIIRLFGLFAPGWPANSTNDCVLYSVCDLQGAQRDVLSCHHVSYNVCVNVRVFYDAIETHQQVHRRHDNVSAFPTVINRIFSTVNIYC